MNSNIGNVIAKVMALTGGAIIGAILANVFDKAISQRSQERSDYDKTRYEQGLTPQSPPQRYGIERQINDEQMYSE